MPEEHESEQIMLFQAQRRGVLIPRIPLTPHRPGQWALTQAKPASPAPCGRSFDPRTLTLKTLVIMFSTP